MAIPNDRLEEYRTYAAKQNAMQDPVMKYADWYEHQGYVDHGYEEIGEGATGLPDAPAQRREKVAVMGALSADEAKDIAEKHLKFLMASVLPPVTVNISLSDVPGTVFPDQLRRVKECLIQIRDEHFESVPGYLVNFEPFQTLCTLFEINPAISTEARASVAKKFSESERMKGRKIDGSVPKHIVGLWDRLTTEMSTEEFTAAVADWMETWQIFKLPEDRTVTPEFRETSLRIVWSMLAFPFSFEDFKESIEAWADGRVSLWPKEANPPMVNQQGTKTGRFSGTEENKAQTPKPAAELVSVNREPPTPEEITEYLAPMVGKKVTAERAQRVPGQTMGVTGILQEGSMSTGDGKSGPFILRPEKPKTPLMVKWDSVKLYEEPVNVDTADGMAEHLNPKVGAANRAQAAFDNSGPTIAEADKQIKDGIAKGVQQAQAGTAVPPTMPQKPEQPTRLSDADTKKYMNKDVTAERKFHDGGNDASPVIEGRFIGLYKCGKNMEYGVLRRIGNKTKQTAIKIETIKLAE
jgi:hypothetical protein